jgi:glycosyltransferase involved in cell wall biosynthesis
MSIFQGRLAVQQRVLPVYRVPFFELLAESCAGGLDLFAGSSRASEAIPTTTDQSAARLTQAQNLHQLGGPLYLCYQRGMPDWLERARPDALILEANPRYLAAVGPVVHRQAGPCWAGTRLAALGQLAGIRRNGGSDSCGGLTHSLPARVEQQYAGQATERIFVAPNAATPPPKDPRPLRPDRFEGQPIVLYVGRLQARKRLDLLIRACAALPADLRPRLRLVGDGPERPALESLAAELYPATEFTGAQFGADLAAHFAAADLFVLPGTGGLAVQEAMSYGLPVMVAQGDGTQNDLVRPSNGWLLPPDDFASLLGALRTALADAPRLRAMGGESYRIVKEEINVETMVDAFVGALNALS